MCSILQRQCQQREQEHGIVLRGGSGSDESDIGSDSESESEDGDDSSGSSACSESEPGDSDHEHESDLDDSEVEEELDPSNPLIAQPPAVLQLCTRITSEPCTRPEVEPLSFRLCGDNIDKNVRCRYMRSDKQTTSLHCFHSYAVQIRMITSHLSNTIPARPLPSRAEMARCTIPSKADDQIIQRNIATLISRVLVTYLEFFKFTFGDVVDRHIEHELEKEMSRTSVVVSIYDNEMK